jgi:hypothetical protein
MNNRIFDHKPQTWQELEELVNIAFCEMGYESQKNQTLTTIRGRIAIDVVAVEKRTPIPTMILCECKYWNKPVNQQIVYAFRSVCVDVGAHYGLVISKKGFQPGAEETRKGTNIHLLNFDQFQEKFFKRWCQGVFMEIVKMRDAFLNKLYQDPKLSAKAFLKYALFEKVSDHFVFNKTFPINVVDPRGSIDLIKKITVKSHRHFFEIAKNTYENL